MNHPRPFLRRAWESLDGPWSFALSDADDPGGVRFDRTITVPFAPETPASGIGEPWIPRCWYRRQSASSSDGGPVRLHFGAVDRIARVWADGELVAEHQGGYSPFSCAVRDDAEIVVCVDDDPTDLEAPRGKQDWQREPHSIWYPRTSGIWRTVWWERVGSRSIVDVRWRSDAAAMTVSLAAQVTGGARLAVRLSHLGQVVVDDAVPVVDDTADRTWALPAEPALLWSPDQPTLLAAELALLDDAGSVLDSASSTAAVRTVEVVDGRFVLNGRPLFLRMALEQGYWPATGATPPDEDAMRAEVVLAKRLGFNGLRLHQKIEDPRLLAWADRLGLLLWGEMPSAYRFSDVAAGRLLAEWAEAIALMRNHPSVVAWVPINESWGVPEIAKDGRQPALLDSLVAVARAFDGTRPVSANDGWETAGGEIVGVHDYDQQAQVLRRRYGSRSLVDGLLTGRRWDGRRADLDRAPAGGRAVVLSEFGGLALAGSDGWGYDSVSSSQQYLDRYRELWRAVNESDGLAGACWTQLTDCYQEVNGVLTADRQPKANLDALAAAVLLRSTTA